MSKAEFKFVRNGKEVSIERTMSSVKRDSNHPVLRMKVMCFNSARIDRIFSIQENAAKTHIKK